MVECLLCKEDALGSNPSGSIRGPTQTESLKYGTPERFGPKTDAPLRESASGKGSMHAPVSPTGRGDDDRMYVQSRRPLDPIQSIRVTVTYIHNSVATMPAGGWLGSSADDGRAKLR